MSVKLIKLIVAIFAPLFFILFMKKIEISPYLAFYQEVLLYLLLIPLVEEVFKSSFVFFSTKLLAICAASSFSIFEIVISKPDLFAPDLGLDLTTRFFVVLPAFIFHLTTVTSYYLVSENLRFHVLGLCIISHSCLNAVTFMEVEIQTIILLAIICCIFPILSSCIIENHFNRKNFDNGGCRGD